jgi:hypothetical protein
VRLDADPGRLGEAYRHCRSDCDRGTVDGPQYWPAVLERCGVAERDGMVDELIERDKESRSVQSQPGCDWAGRRLRTSLP